jgi:hypothetical protein
MIYEKVNGKFKIVDIEKKVRPKKEGKVKELKKSALAIWKSNNWKWSQELTQALYPIKMYYNKEGRPKENAVTWATVCKEIFGDRPSLQVVNKWLRPYEQLRKRYTDGKPIRVKDEEETFTIEKSRMFKQKILIQFKIPEFPFKDFVRLISLKK